jgi:hypothetical protein
MKSGMSGSHGPKTKIAADSTIDMNGCADDPQRRAGKKAAGFRAD